MPVAEGIVYLIGGGGGVRFLGGVVGDVGGGGIHGSLIGAAAAVFGTILDLLPLLQQPILDPLPPLHFLISLLLGFGLGFGFGAGGDDSCEDPDSDPCTCVVALVPALDTLTFFLLLLLIGFLFNLS